MGFLPYAHAQTLHRVTVYIQTHERVFCSTQWFCGLCNPCYIPMSFLRNCQQRTTYVFSYVPYGKGSCDWCSKPEMSVDIEQVGQSQKISHIFVLPKLTITANKVIWNCKQWICNMNDEVAMHTQAQSTHTHTHLKYLFIYCTIQKAKLVHQRSARQALWNKSITVRRGMEKATFTAQPLIHTSSRRLTLFIAVQMHSVYLPRHRGPI